MRLCTSLYMCVRLYVCVCVHGVGWRSRRVVGRRERARAYARIPGKLIQDQSRNNHRTHFHNRSHPLPAPSARRRSSSSLSRLRRANAGVSNGGSDPVRTCVACRHTRSPSLFLAPDNAQVIISAFLFPGKLMQNACSARSDARSHIFIRHFRTTLRSSLLFDCALLQKDTPGGRRVIAAGNSACFKTR